MRSSRNFTQALQSLWALALHTHSAHVYYQPSPDYHVPYLPIIQRYIPLRKGWGYYPAREAGVYKPWLGIVLINSSFRNRTGHTVDLRLHLRTTFSYGIDDDRDTYSLAKKNTYRISISIDSLEPTTDFIPMKCPEIFAYIDNVVTKVQTSLTCDGI